MNNFYTNVSLLGNRIAYREIKDGKENSGKFEYAPTIFIPTNKESKYSTIEGQLVAPWNPGNIKDTREFIQQYEDNESVTIYGNTNWVTEFIAEHYGSNVEFDSNYIRIFTFDIEVYSESGFPETEEAKHPITAITVHDSYDDCYHVFTFCTFSTERNDIKVYHSKTEKELLNDFIEFWAKNYPHVMTGWNTEVFDIPYLCRRIENLFTEHTLKRLSPFSSVRSRTKKGAYGSEFLHYEIMGISNLDYISLYKKHVLKPRESYTLDHIAYVELGESKLGYDEYFGLSDFYLNDPQSYIEYNIKDTELVVRLDQKLKLMDLTFTVAYYAGVTYEDTFSPVKTWDTLITEYLKEQGYVVPPKEDVDKKVPYEGAYVKEPKTGFSDWVLSFDLASLYPSLIMQYNIGPDTIIDEPVIDESVDIDSLLYKKVDTSYLPFYNCNVTPKGVSFSNEGTSFFAEMMKRLFAERKANKDKKLEYEKQEEQEGTSKELQDLISKYDIMQNSQKVLLNSLYGASGNKYFRWFDTRIASAITTGGQLSIRWIEHEINDWLNHKLLGNSEYKDYILAIDTDSIYIELGDLVEKLGLQDQPKWEVVEKLDKIAEKKIENFILEAYQRLADYVNAKEQAMVMEREVIADKAVWTAKKRYIMNLYDEEGVPHDPPKQKIMGMEAIRSTFSEEIKNELKECYRIILQEDEKTLKQEVSRFYDQWKNMDIEQIAFNSSVKGLAKYSSKDDVYAKGTPIHVRGSLMFNHIVDEYGLDKFPYIQEGEKIKYVFLKVPNPTFENVLAFPGFFPRDTGLEEYVDYSKMFEKAFINPLKTVLDEIGWDYEEKATLEDFFS